MGLLRKMLFPFSLIYGVAVYIRNLLYDWRIFASKSFKTPTICVGNLSVGGTGKTPMIELLVRLLASEYKVAVLSRGYKRKSKGFVKASSTSTAENLGDEPYQMFLKFPEITITVDANRRRGIEKLEEQVQPDVILLDDAFQHRQVSSGFSILLTAYNSLYSKDWYLPTGNLRDSKGQAKRANIIVVTKSPSNLTKEEQQKIIRKLRLKSNQTVLFSSLSYNLELGGSGSLKVINDLKKEKITLVTGIADPTPLVQFLDENQIRFEHLSFGDHHFFTPEELALLKSKPNLVTTEKDYVRLKKEIKNCNYIEVKHHLSDEKLEVLKRELDQFMTPYS